MILERIYATTLIIPTRAIGFILIPIPHFGTIIFSQYLSHFGVLSLSVHIRMPATLTAVTFHSVTICRNSFGSNMSLLKVNETMKEKENHARSFIFFLSFL